MLRLLVRPRMQAGRLRLIRLCGGDDGSCIGGCVRSSCFVKLRRTAFAARGPALGRSWAGRGEGQEGRSGTRT